MRLNYKGMEIIVKKDYDLMSKKAAQMIEAQVTLNSRSVLGLATGSTPEGMYKELIGIYNNDEIDFSDVISFNLDEYYMLDSNNDQSYAYYMNHHLFDHINIKKENIHIPSGVSENVDESCQLYDSKILSAGNIDLQILGIGGNGHIGFNEPDIRFEAGTHLVELDEDTIEANARFFDKVEDVPKKAISMGVRNIMHSKKIVLMASGAGKAGILADMIFGDITPNIPASILQLHNNVTLILDEEAASEILKKIK